MTLFNSTLKKRFIVSSLYSLLFIGNAYADHVYLNLSALQSYSEFDFHLISIVTGNEFNKETKTSQLLGNIALGYGKEWCSGFYLGTEIGTFLNKNEASVTRGGVLITNQFFRNHFTLHDYLTIDVLPGYEFNRKFIIYGRAGVTGAHRTIELDENERAGTAGFKFSSNEIGTRVGVGIDYKFCSGFSLGADYIHSTYPRFSIIPPSLSNHSIKTNSDMVGVHIRWNLPI